MILIDTSVWIDHLNEPLSDMREAVEQGIVSHPFVIGEIALGSLADRQRVLRDLLDLPTVLPIPHWQVMQMIEREGLFGTSVQYVDMHLLASARVTSGCKLWTRDKRLRATAGRFDVAAGFD